MEETSVQDVRKEYQAKKQEMSSLKTALHSLHHEKETAFQQLKDFRIKISADSARIQELKIQRQALTGQVKELKGERDKLNQVVKEKAQAPPVVEQKKKEFGDAKFPAESPHKLKMEIARLERKLETEVMPFPKEQELNKKLKELKAAFKKFAAILDASKEASAMRAEFSESRRKAQDAHQQVQETAQKSQDVHLGINAVYDEIKKWREEEKAVAEKYLRLKEEFFQTKKKTEELSKQLDTLSSQLKERDENSFQSRVLAKTAEVQEKMKKGKKLSTEDILAFQAMD
ncbi:hypothetical protein J4210_00740 [Candidatus Woesearchaeota archaeon]|nr:hypothetical protein [Candidatus Woesearchaeota archaeon]